MKALLNLTVENSTSFVSTRSSPVMFPHIVPSLLDPMTAIRASGSENRRPSLVIPGKVSRETLKERGGELVRQKKEYDPSVTYVTHLAK